MSTAIITTAADAGRRIELARWAWLDAKSKRSGSLRTAQLHQDADGRPIWRGVYATTLDHFRRTVQQSGLDLDGDPPAVALLAQVWAGASWAGAARPIAATTYNQRLAIVASFYTYARRHQFLRGDNPIDLVERRPVQSYATARAIPPTTVRSQLNRINRTTLPGARDYALLLVGLSTGRRASELAGLRWRDVQVQAPRVTLHWTRTKGGKQLRDTLSAAVSTALLQYLRLAYGAQLASLPSAAPIWISTSRQNRGAAITTQTIGDICQRHLGISKIHTLRHTFAQAMLTVGGTVRDVQERLGHADSATTERYLHALQSAENPHAEALADLFGVG
jgi:integrase